ncbi:MAG: Holliday junction branch migration protein RuvA [Pseudomonadota bacterium]|jgi:Holliday junction DNA helicase RuvA|nr:Holliday junction branch migration protein RuvA [Porticoccaceae bacterium]MEC7158412.1 Holliday junction branch migration protein RuvA [Pseudomonadota bacterium]MDP7405031.1 Holliday junction branch migration protein RuvA [Porticoccaceae bacterium]MEC7455203.1 Holliday junction branch migration protein RuvA [Pseudomonadota bacterium]MEC7620129.1 Holliday junction branch migration protein RuvA [Pseudomonadota bacterium]|tara:strand:+ start:817 stop:1410 length:594 start_codon:yes stop_codon:yes gene_type:complete
MIVKLAGKLLDKQAPCALIDVNGVGYEINVSLMTFVDLPSLGSDVEMHTHLVVREDSHTLYGFLTVHERSLFKDLIKVNGVGPKMALGMLSGMTVDEFARAILNRDVSSLVKLPGVGKKTAERLVIEMKDAIDGVGLSGASENTITKSDIRLEAESGLLSLGYKAQDITKILNNLDYKNASSSEDIIKMALQSIAKL